MKSFFLTLLACCMIDGYLAAQVSADYYHDNSAFYPRPEIITPQTADIMRFDNTPVNMNSGRLDLSIPLIEFQDKDFNLPINVFYNSAGFKPAEPDNYTGRNWSLNCGGIIFREVSGMPDDIASQDAGSGFFAKGFLTILKSYRNRLNKREVHKNIFVDPNNYAEINIAYNSALATIRALPHGQQNGIESTADPYHFSFGPYSGKFMLNFDGSVSSITTSGGECTINLDKYDLVSGFNAHNATISITTDDGYIYRFGGNDTYAPMEYTPLSWKRSYVFHGYYDGTGHTINTYYLTEIVAPNGRKLTIKYKDIPKEYHTNPHLLSPGYGAQPLFDKGINLLYSYSGRPTYEDITANAYDGKNTPVYPEHHLTKIALIDYIETDHAKIQFYYSVRDKHVSYESPGTTDPEFPFHCGAKLDSVIYKVRDTKPIEVTRLKYLYGTGNRMFLQSVRNSKRGSYHFEYNSIPANGSDPMTTNIDHWGYWLGVGSTSNILPKMEQDEFYQYQYNVLTKDREPTGKNPETSLLKKIVYPTGGYATFEYEPHEYSQWLSVNWRHDFIPSLEFPSGVHHAIAGGARVKNIKYYTDAGLSKQTNYEYTDVSPLVSGELMYMPFYQYANYQIINNRRVQKNLYRGAYGLLPPTYASDHVRYPYVKEILVDHTNSQSQTNGYAIYAFTSYRTNPDVYGFYYGKEPYAFGAYGGGFSATPPAIVDDIEYNSNLVLKPKLNASIERGKLLYKQVYSADDKLLASTEYKYKRIIRDTCLFIYTATPLRLLTATSLFRHVGFEQFYKYLPVEEKTTEYAAGADEVGLSRIDKYEYDKNGYLISRKHIRNQGDTLETKYSYPHKRLIPPDKRTFVIKGNTNTLINEEIFESDATQLGYWKVKNIKTGDGKKSDTRVEYVKYDRYGNPAQIVTDGKYSTVYIWSYYGQYLIAVIENATYDQITAALGEDPGNYLQSMNPVMYPLNQLRKQIPAARITTCTYLPHIGMYSSTDPAGSTIRYGYDSAGRLTEIWKVSDKEISTLLQVNKYNLVNQ